MLWEGLLSRAERKRHNVTTLRLEAEQQYRQLFECNPHPMWIFDFESLSFLAVNDAAVYHYGFSREEFLTMTIKDIRPEEEVFRLMSDLRENHRGHSIGGVWKHRRKDGTVFDVQIVSHEVIWNGRHAKLVLAMDISEQRQAERALHQSQQLLQEIIDSSTAIVSVKDLEGRYVLVNHRFCELIQLSLDEILGKTDYDILPRTVADQFRQFDQRVLAAGAPLTEELTAWKENKHYTFLTAKSLLRDSTGNAYLICAISSDITERKRAEDALREAEERFRTVADFTYDWEYWAGPDQEMIYVSPSCEDLTGYSAEDFMQDPELVLKIVHPDDRGAMKQHLWSSFCGPERSRESNAAMDFRIVTREGSMRWMSHKCRPVFDRDGQWRGRRVSNRDITDRKRSEERVQRLSRLYATLSQVNQTIVRVKDRESLFQSICEIAIEFGQFSMAWIAVFEGDGCDMKKVACGLPPALSLDPEEIERDATLFSCVPLLPVLREGKIIVYHNIAELRHLGDWREAALRHSYRAAAIVPVRCRDEVVGALNLYSQTVGYFTDSEELALLEEIGLDISFALGTIQSEAEHQKAREEQAKLEEQLRQAQKMESIGRLAGGIAHDFNNLLGVIIGYSDIALRNLPAADPRGKPLEEVKKAGERAAQLTHQLLAFSRKQVIDPKVFDLNTAVGELTRMLERMIGEDIELNMILADHLGRIKADRGQIEQVLMNLVVNARDAMPVGGKITIETSDVDLDEAYAHEHFPVVAGSYVMLAVSDTGIGMSPEIQKHIFEPFFTTKEQGKGTGLGLSTVYGIVRQSGGYVWVYSEPDHGTTFKVYLPRVKSEEESPTQVKAKRILGGTETILLVEDEAGIRKLTQECLASKGYMVLSARDGLEALKIAEQHGEAIDLLLTDVVLPGLGGPKLAKQYLGLHPETQVLYMSGYTDDAIIHHGVLDQGIAFLQKPFTIDDLWLKVRAILDAKASKKAVL